MVSLILSRNFCVEGLREAFSGFCELRNLVVESSDFRGVPCGSRLARTECSSSEVSFGMEPNEELKTPLISL